MSLVVDSVDSQVRVELFVSGYHTVFIKKDGEPDKRALKIPMKNFLRLVRHSIVGSSMAKKSDPRIRFVKEMRTLGLRREGPRCYFKKIRRQKTPRRNKS